MGFLTDIQLFWLILFVVFLVAELVSLGLTSIWFAGGSLVALLLSFTSVSIYVQVIAAVIVSLALLFLIRPWAGKHFNRERVQTNAQSLVGQTAIVIEEIDNIRAQGRVLVRGQEWSARSTAETEHIPKDARVTIRRISGVKLIVEREDGPQDLQ
ncbi:MAG: NfeD family protein [Clostridiales bacterium]|nr:NfeD family protein [Clostridiales bacterium]